MIEEAVEETLGPQRDRLGQALESAGVPGPGPRIARVLFKVEDSTRAGRTRRGAGRGRGNRRGGGVAAASRNTSHFHMKALRAVGGACSSARVC